LREKARVLKKAKALAHSGLAPPRPNISAALIAETGELAALPLILDQSPISPSERTVAAVRNQAQTLGAAI
jgi:hypothetical protein